jgi:hypothetical protein
MQVIRWQGAEQPEEHELRSRMQKEGLAARMLGRAA